MDIRSVAHWFMLKPQYQHTNRDLGVAHRKTLHVQLQFATVDKPRS